ncbi:hypothetical protein Rhe02_26050 [Rhizocola hellebori]|uniref:DUF1800 domain-containing protein n=1 Tax=Rhizocola hellebori TaxID=1392758 RepID=A0A8J3Q780_9ACTN|nr:DUF1800 domain-containing protein [Rhizocola hellebori]GIH04538.1 hypothetical protein Rhe02_26050 [Rhizocola hellebori]
MAASVALLLRRAGFGPTSAELSDAIGRGYSATVSELTTPTARDPGAQSTPLPNLGIDPYNDLPNPTKEQRAAADVKRGADTEALHRWWLDRVTVANRQAVEKLVFFWHGHWATSIRKFGSPQWMLAQHQKIRESADFGAMARKMVTDPALVYWLDGQLNSKDAPNENLGRELLELFMLGIGNYTESDVKAAGRALTGWRVDLGVPQTAIFFRDSHDAAEKTVLGVTSKFTATSLVDFLATQPACPRFIASRLWFRYASAEVPIPPVTQDRMIAAFPFPNLMLKALFTDEAFQATAGHLVKQPIEWFVGALRQLGIRPAGFSSTVLQEMLFGLRSLGQMPFAPPSVGGWPSGAAWLTPATAQVRFALAARLAEMARPPKLTVEGLADTLAVDTWTDRTYAALKGVSEPRRMMTLGLVSPEYLVT